MKEILDLVCIYISVVAPVWVGAIFFGFPLGWLCWKSQKERQLLDDEERRFNASDLVLHSRIVGIRGTKNGR